MGRKFFYLDHTAEVLENYRRIQENEIYNKVLHETRQKKAFLKKESRKPENLLESGKPDISEIQDSTNIVLETSKNSYLDRDFLMAQGAHTQ